MFYW
jgi:hypothetical protein